jgi:hypothetical protein
MRPRAAEAGLAVLVAVGALVLLLAAVVLLGFGVAGGRQAADANRLPPATAARPADLEARYDKSRLATGFAAAGLLLGAAAWLVRTTDWREPSEASVPR